MTLDEMRQYEWSVSWSGGKDSTATIILMHEHGIPIKQIIYVRMMFDDELPATLPVMTDFVDHAAGVFRSWGYDVKIIRAIRTAMDAAVKVYQKSKYDFKVGRPYGMTAFCRGACHLQSVKASSIQKELSSDEWQMIGYAADEPDRIHRLGGRKRSIMVKLGVTEQDAFRICREAGLLSPLYGTGILRDGCFFCPNAAKKERLKLRAEHPELVQKINELIEMPGWDVSRLACRNNWIRDYYAEKKEQESGQMTLDL